MRLAMLTQPSRGCCTGNIMLAECQLPMKLVLAQQKHAEEAGELRTLLIKILLTMIAVRCKCQQIMRTHGLILG